MMLRPPEGVCLAGLGAFAQVQVDQVLVANAGLFDQSFKMLDHVHARDKITCCLIRHCHSQYGVQLVGALCDSANVT